MQEHVAQHRSRGAQSGSENSSPLPIDIPVPWQYTALFVPRGKNVTFSSCLQRQTMMGKGHRARWFTYMWLLLLLKNIDREVRDSSSIRSAGIDSVCFPPTGRHGKQKSCPLRENRTHIHTRARQASQSAVFREPNRHHSRSPSHDTLCKLFLHLRLSSFSARTTSKHTWCELRVLSVAKLISTHAIFRAWASKGVKINL